MGRFIAALIARFGGMFSKVPPAAQSQAVTAMAKSAGISTGGKTMIMPFLRDVVAKYPVSTTMIISLLPTLATYVPLEDLTELADSFDSESVTAEVAGFLQSYVSRQNAVLGDGEEGTPLGLDAVDLIDTTARLITIKKIVEDGYRVMNGKKAFDALKLAIMLPPEDIEAVQPLLDK
jgi:hypothetical protein